GLCAGGGYMVDAVLLFFRTGELMLLYNIIFIIINRRRANQPGLAFTVHYQLVNIIAGFIFTEQHFTLNKCMQVIFCFFIYFLCMYICIFRKINFRFCNME